MTLPVPHESAEFHVTGEAAFVDDMPVGALVGRVVTSPHAHAEIIAADLSAARREPGIRAVLSCQDIPGVNQMGPVMHDEPCLAAREVSCVGQAVFLIAGETEEACRRAESKIRVEYRPLPAILSIDGAMAANTLLGSMRTMGRGDVEGTLAAAPHVIRGELRTGAQEHWYLETQTALCIPGEGDDMTVHASSQNPSETQLLVAEVLGVRKHNITVQVRRIGGGFGGKETQANHVACWAALLCKTTGTAVKIRLFRDDDMIMTGKRHRFLSRYEVGFDDNGMLLAAKFELNSDAGCATDLSHAIMERAMLHCDNAYFIPHISVTARVWRTNFPSNTAFRGFGGPQGMALVETVVDRIARLLQRDPAEVRRRNYYGIGTRDVTHYGQTVEGNRLFVLHDRLTASSEYAARRRAVEEYNRTHEFEKRGIALTPVKFGISFTTTFLNQAGALVLLYDDGSVLVNHGGTEMGQGIHTKIRQIAAEGLGVDIARVRVNATDTAKVPNTPPTAASTGTDLNGAAVLDAIGILRQRIASEMAGIWSNQHPGAPTREGDVEFVDDTVLDRTHPGRIMGFAEVLPLMRQRQVSLSATGFYKTPGIGWDKRTGTGKPFHYYAFGVAVSEVEVDTLTGRAELLRTDILHDTGASINPGIDAGQVYGGFVQGLGWVTTEEVVWDAAGNLLTHSPDTYKIPTSNDIPRDFRVSLLDGAPNPAVVGHSKAVGEPPFMLSLSVWLAIKDAVSAVNQHRTEPALSLPATTESIILAAEELRILSQAGGGA